MTVFIRIITWKKRRGFCYKRQYLLVMFNVLLGLAGAPHGAGHQAMAFALLTGSERFVIFCSAIRRLNAIPSCSSFPARSVPPDHLSFSFSFCFLTDCAIMGNILRFFYAASDHSPYGENNLNASENTSIFSFRTVFPLSVWGIEALFWYSAYLIANCGQRK
jgi:hypothetical protein